jgi:hypothetical protein
VTVVSIPDPPYRRRSSLYATTTADDAGRFELNLAPGTYKVLAFEDIEDGMWQDPDFIRSVESRGRPVAIGEGFSGRLSVDIPVIPFR